MHHRLAHPRTNYICTFLALLRYAERLEGRLSLKFAIPVARHAELEPGAMELGEPLDYARIQEATEAEQVRIEPADLAGNPSLVQIEQPPQITADVNETLTDPGMAVVWRLVERETSIMDDGVERPLEAGMVGVVFAHVSQVNAMCGRLLLAFSDVRRALPAPGSVLCGRAGALRTC